MNEREASQLVRHIIRASPPEGTTAADVNVAIAYLDALERAYLDSKAQRDEDEHPSLIKLISTDATPRSTRLTFGGINVRMVQRASLALDAGAHFPAILRTTSIDESRLRSGYYTTPPTIDSEIPLQSFVFRGVRA